MTAERSVLGMACALSVGCAEPAPVQPAEASALETVDLSATPLPSAVASSPASGLAASGESVWPAIPKAPVGRTYREVRAGTLQVAIAIPEGGKVEATKLPFGHDVVYVDSGATRVSITFSSGGTVFAPGLSKTPPKIASLPVDRIVRDPENVTVAFRRKGGELVVSGWVRGAECQAESLAPASVDEALALCASLRVLAPGPTTREVAPDQKPFPKVPADTFVRHDHGVTQLFAGQFVAKVLARKCPTDAEVRDAFVRGDPHVTHATYPHGSVTVSRAEDEFEGVTVRTSTTVWAERGAACCIATIPEHFTPPSEAQIDWVARWCDGLE